MAKHRRPPRESDPGHEAAPPELLEAIAAPAGGRVVLVLGAGCSHEQPTGLPLAGDLANECYRRLVADHRLPEGTCDDPHDLSAVAEAVVHATGSQRDLVERFPPDRFRQAQPNEGHLIAAALLREGAVTTLMTLNFDLAQGSALAGLGARGDIATIRGPDEHRRISARNLIYLHRNIESDADDLILRQEQLEAAWRDGWEEIVTQRVIGGPVTVFAGLGSPSAVLVETTKKILGALGDIAHVYVIDPAEPDESSFFAALGLGHDRYIKLGWSEFMHQLAARVTEEHRATMECECEALIDEHGWNPEDVSGVCARLAALGLIGLGRLRARWLLDDTGYAPHPRETALVRVLSDLLIAAGMIERESGTTARFDDEGIVEFQGTRQGHVLAMLCSGSGWMRWELLEGKVSFRRQQLERRGRSVRLAIVSGVVGERAGIAPPESISGEAETDSIVFGEAQIQLVTVDELRFDPELIHRLIA